MNDNAISTVQAALAETSWLSVPCPVEYLPALARDVLYALGEADFAVVPIPTVAFKGPHDTDASMFRTAADKAESARYPVGGSNVGAAVAAVLRAVAASREDPKP